MYTYTCNKTDDKEKRYTKKKRKPVRKIRSAGLDTEQKKWSRKLIKGRINDVKKKRKILRLTYKTPH